MRIRDLKEAIDKVDHWQVMERLIGVPEIRPRQMLRSPLREGDTHPSFGLFRNTAGQARWKDFAMDNGDVYHLCMAMRSETFQQAVRTVGQILGLESGTPAVVAPVKLALRKMIEDVRAKCTWELRDWNAQDFQYWHLQYGINRDLMEQYGFLPCASFQMITVDGRTLNYAHTQDNPMYVIQIGSHGKLYRPLNPDKKFKYIGNTDRNDVFGMAQLKKQGKCQHLVWSAGQKDGLAIKKFLRVQILAANAEGSIVEENVMYDVFSMVEKKMWVLYDNDKTGIIYTEKMVKKYPFITPIHLSAFSSSNDFCDLVKNRESNALRDIRNLFT